VISKLVICPECGHEVKVGGRDVWQVRCPNCHQTVHVPGQGVVEEPPEEEPPADAPPTRRRKKKKARPPSRPRIEGPTKKCPNCDQDMPEAAVLCIECGYNVQTGQKLDTVRERFHREWPSDLSLPARVVLAVCLELFFLLGFLFLPPLAASFIFVISIPVVVLFLGTFETLTLTRQDDGRSLATVLLRVGFYPWGRRVHDLDDYRSIVLDRKPGDISALVWVALGLLMGVVPGIIIWSRYYADQYIINIRNKDEMAQVYQTRSEKKVKEVAEALCDIGDLNYG
jgi:hypothetical protein